MTPSTSTFSACIAAASRAHPILRRALASALYAEMRLAPDAIGIAADWRALSQLLIDCSISLYGRPHMVPRVPGDVGRALLFGSLSRDAHNRSVMMKLRCERAALRSGRRVPQVIDAACTVVRQ